MQSTLDSIIGQLESLLENAKNMESRYLSEILSLEKLINHTLKSTPFVPLKQSKQPLKSQKSEISQLSVEEKVNALMNDIEMRQKNIENEKSEVKNKFEVKQPQVIVEKKPPLPTVNRNEKSIRTPATTFVPPRNRNEVTGKVTQTTMRTSGQKVFKPQKGSLKKLDSKPQIKSQGRSSIEKKSDKKQPKVETIPSREMPMIKKEVQAVREMQVKQEKFMPLPNIQNQKATIEKVIEVKKEVVANNISKIKFASFHKQVEQILDELLGQGPKNHKKQLEKLLLECQNEQKGHRMHEDTNRKIYIKKANNYAVSRIAVYPMFSFQITRKKWLYHPELNDYHLLLDSLINELENLELQKDCRIDKKSQFRITHSNLLFTKAIEQIRDDSEHSKSQVPQRLQLNFTFAEQPKQSGDNDSTELQQLSELNLNDQLLQMLQEIAEKGTLQRSELRGIQILSEIGIFKSKRSPLIVMQKEYTSWKEHYADQHST